VKFTVLSQVFRSQMGTVVYRRNDI
jgi:hypothetical protein